MSHRHVLRINICTTLIFLLDHEIHFNRQIMTPYAAILANATIFYHDIMIYKYNGIFQFLDPFTLQHFYYLASFLFVWNGGWVRLIPKSVRPKHCLEIHLWPRARDGNEAHYSFPRLLSKMLQRPKRRSNNRHLNSYKWAKRLIRRQVRIPHFARRVPQVGVHLDILHCNEPTARTLN